MTEQQPTIIDKLPLEPDTRHVGLPPYQSERKFIVQWILRHDYRLLFNMHAKKPALYGRTQRPLCGDSLGRRMDASQAVDYYTVWPDDFGHDAALCHEICPLFVLHGCAKMLRNDADRYHASFDIMLMLHVIKARLVVLGKQVAPFVRRLLGLAERYANITNGKRAMLRYPHYLAVATVMMTTNLDFMVWDDAGHRYVFTVDDIKKPCAIRDVIEMCLVAPMVLDSSADELMTRETRLARYRSNVNVFTQAFMEFQMDAHCVKIERLWLPYHLTSRRHPDKVVPTCIVMQLDAPPLDGIEDGAHLMQRLNDNVDTACYVDGGHCHLQGDAPFNLYEYVSSATALQVLQQ